MEQIEARRRLLLQVKRQVGRHLGATPKAIADYSKPFERESRSKFRQSSKPELVAAVTDADIVFAADFHAFSQAQRTHLKILRSLPLNRKVTLALEAIPHGFENEISNYLNGKLSEASFLRKVEWQKHWGFPWENYRPLFHLAKQRGFKVIGLNKTMAQTHRQPRDLQTRDKFAGKILARELRENRDRLIYVVYGELHIATPHLPKATCQALKFKPSIVQIYQNLERVYFSLSAKQLEGRVDVVALGKNRFAINSAPPWVQWQSYLMYLDSAIDSELDFDEDAIDFTDRVSSLVKVLASDLKLNFKVDDLSIYSPHDDKIWGVLESTLPARQQRAAERYILLGKCFYLPVVGVGYLGRASVNQAAEVAGQFIHAKLCGRKVQFGEMPKDFERMIWVKAVGYFLSKLLNPKRQAQTLTDLRTELESSSRQGESRQTLALALDQRMTEIIWVQQGRRRNKKILPRHESRFEQASRILGDMMGERLFLAYHSNRVKKGQLMEWLKHPIEKKDFDSFYADLVAELEPVSHRMRNKKERL